MPRLRELKPNINVHLWIIIYGLKLPIPLTDSTEIDAERGEPPLKVEKVSKL
jgi:hypothetical protein